jgi:hypothetical protein
MEGVFDDWVKKRAECSMAVAFEHLRSAVKHDVEERNAQRAQGAHYVFRLVEPAETTFSVVREGTPEIPRRVVRFDAEDTTLVVESKDGVVNFTATLTLNNKGECRFLVDKEELEEWHIRKKALEGIFFRLST